MKNYLIIVFLLLSVGIFAQDDSKTKFQKNKYELAVSCYKKADFKNALDLFSVASKIKPENELGKESIKKVDSLKSILRKDIINKALGVWKMTGDKPVWAVKNTVDTEKPVDEFIEITKTQIVFYEQDKKTRLKKVIKTEDLVYYNKDKSDSLFSAVILSDGTIWNCNINDASNVLHVINIAKQTENGVQKIESENLERYYLKM